MNCILCNNQISVRPGICQAHLVILKSNALWNINQPLHIWYVEHQLARSGIRISRERIRPLLASAGISYLDTEGDLRVANARE